VSMVEHARRELGLIGEDPDVVEYMVGVIEKFAEFGHSGGSASIMIPRLCKLLSQEALAPLTSDPDEWEDRTEISGTPLWQNKRDSRAFSTDGGKTWSLVGRTGSAPENSGPGMFTEAIEILTTVEQYEADVPEQASFEEWRSRAEYVDRELRKGELRAWLALTAAFAAAFLPDSVAWREALGL
jgi:hypothetical protein